MNAEERLRDAIRLALEGRAMLFLGAGACSEARNKTGNLPSGQELADVLAKDCRLGPGYALDVISDHILETKSETRLINLLKKHLKVDEVGDSLKSVAEIPWSRIWTTNYDDAIEQALAANQKNYQALTTSAEVANARGRRLLVIHINGALKKVGQVIPNDFVLTSKSYATQSFADNAWATIFRNDLQKSKAIFFIGYSISDIDIARLIFNPTLFKDKIYFIDRQQLDPVLNTKLSSFGTVYAKGIDNFAAAIESERSQWIEPAYIEDYPSWTLIADNEELRPPTDNDFYDLILKGIAKKSLIKYQHETPDDPVYSILRNEETNCINHLYKQNAVALFIGSFANGKTLSAHSVSTALAARGFDVFELTYPYDSAEAELQRLCERDRPFVLLLENYARHLSLVKTFSRFAPAACALLLTEQTEVHELGEHNLLESTTGRDLRIYSLDELHDSEINHFASLLDLRGLWGEKAGMRKSQKLAYIKEECGRQLNAVLLDVAKSPQIRERLNRIVRHFDSFEDGLRILTALCLLEAIRESPRTDVVAELLNLSSDAFRRACKDPEAKQILATNSHVANFRSSIIANIVLKKACGAAFITDIVSECVKRAHESRYADRHLQTIAKELMRFGTLERILPEEHKAEALQNFYESIKNIPSIRTNPHFWLQYAMARLNRGDVPTARRYFEQSYSYARDIEGYDTFQIDNHYCRLLLREAEDSTDSEEAFRAVDEVLQTLKKQVLRENRHYPYRSAWSLEGVTKRHQLYWSVPQRRSVLNGSKYLIDAASHLEARVARSTAVIGGLERLNRVVELLSE